jgi:hypothetical protein
MDCAAGLPDAEIKKYLTARHTRFQVVDYSEYQNMPFEYCRLKTLYPVRISLPIRASSPFICREKRYVRQIQNRVDRSGPCGQHCDTGIRPVR